MRHLDGGIVPLDQPHSAGNPSESLMTAIFLTPLGEQLHAYANAKEGHAAFQHGFIHRLDHARHSRQRIAASATGPHAGYHHSRPDTHPPRADRMTAV